MRIPNFKDLVKGIERKGFYSASYATFLHPNPHFYKYYWWVFWQGSPCDGDDFLSNRYRMPMKQAFELIDNLRKDQQSYWLYNKRLPRLDPDNTPFDPNAEIWQNAEWAKPFDEDRDDEYRGFK